MMEPTALIVRRFDALSVSLRIFSTNDGGVGVEPMGLMTRRESTLGSLIGYGENPDHAVTELWRAVEDLDHSVEWVRAERADGRLQYYEWNGAAWKEVPASDLGFPDRKVQGE